jgi:hypothetical protein
MLRENWAEVFLDDFVSSKPVQLTNTQSIDQASGIPRETVRRKLETMRARGWIERDDKGNWTPSPCAAMDLRTGSQGPFSSSGRWQRRSCLRTGKLRR